MSRVFFIVIVTSFLVLMACSTEKTVNQCGTDLDCFIESSKECGPATLEQEVPGNVLGADVVSTNSVEILGKNNSKCLFKITFQKINISLEGEIREQMLESGMTEEQIEEELRNSSEEVTKEMAGRNGICKFKTSDLTDMLYRWKEFKFLSTDFDRANCEGSFFGEGNQDR